MACSSGCLTPGAHASYGACLRSKRLQVQDVQAHKFNQNQNSELSNYVKAREAGLQPDGVFQHQTDKAWKISDETGSPYRADAR